MKTPTSLPSLPSLPSLAAAATITALLLVPTYAHAEPPPSAPAAAPAAVAVVSAPPAPAPEPSAAYEYHPPRVVDYAGGDIPPNGKLEDRVRIELVGLGLGTTVGMYGLSVLYAASTCGAQMECRAGSDSLYIPVVGPFMTAGKAPTSGGRTLAIFDGVVQTTGLVVAAMGVLIPRQVLVIYDKKVTVRVDPVTTGSGMGVGVTMTNF